MFWCVLYLEKLLEGRMYRGIGHKRQGVERQELSGLAQCRPSGLQIVFEMCDPVLKLSFILYYTSIFLHLTKNDLHLDWKLQLKDTMSFKYWFKSCIWLNERFSWIFDLMRTSVGQTQ